VRNAAPILEENLINYPNDNLDRFIDCPAIHIENGHYGRQRSNLHRNHFVVGHNQFVSDNVNNYKGIENVNNYIRTTNFAPS
jgi:hypothetical protein